MDRPHCSRRSRTTAPTRTPVTGSPLSPTPAPRVEVDRPVITGRNPASSAQVAAELLKKLARSPYQAPEPEERLDVPHAWLVEDLPGGRVRILTQETQIGLPAAELARQTPAPMPNGHQAWLAEPVRAASGGLDT